MKAILKFVCVVLAFCSVSAFADSQGNFGVVDMASIFHDSPQVKSINAALEKQFSPTRDQIVKMNTAFQTDIQKYQKNKAVMSADDLNALKTQITNEESQLRKAQAQFQQQLFEAQNSAMSKFLDQVKAATQTIAKQKNLTMVLPKNTILYFDANMDITKDVMEQLKS